MLLSDNFVQNHWLPRRPTVLRHLIDTATLAQAGTDTVFGSCVEPVKAVLFQSAGASDGEGIKKLPHVHEAPALFRELCASGQRGVMYFMELAGVAPGFQRLLELVDFGYAWRHYTHMVALPAPGTMIDAHVDLLDSLIIQLQGTRRWKVWDADLRTKLHVQLNNWEPLESMHTSDEPLIDTELSAGDVLFIPAPYPHQAFSDDSGQSALSMSVGWATITPIRVLRAVIMMNERRGELEALFEQEPEPYLTLIPDPEIGMDPVPHIVDYMIDRLNPAQRLGMDRAVLLQRLRYVKLGALGGMYAPGSIVQWKRAAALTAGAG
jgi:hypothetical protein